MDRLAELIPLLVAVGLALVLIGLVITGAVDRGARRACDSEPTPPTTAAAPR